MGNRKTPAGNIAASLGESFPGTGPSVELDPAKYFLCRSLGSVQKNYKG